MVLVVGGVEHPVQPVLDSQWPRMKGASWSGQARMEVSKAIA